MIQDIDCANNRLWQQQIMGCHGKQWYKQDSQTGIFLLQFELAYLQQPTMKKVLALLAIQPEYQEFAVPELKAILAPLKIPFPTLFADSAPLPDRHFLITHRSLLNFPYITLTVPDFELHRKFFETASKKAVMVSKFVLLISDGKDYEELVKNGDQEILDSECRDWNHRVMCEFVTRNRVIQKEEQVEKIHMILEKMDIRGKIDVKNAAKKYQLIEHHDWYEGHHHDDTDQTLKRVYFGIELSSCKIGRAKFNNLYQLSHRIYLGPTSADNDLAFLMCNQARLTPGSLVLDPFVGTGGLLIPPSTHGSHVFGCDLDMRVLNGYAVGRINKKSPYYSADKELETFVPKINLSFDQYGLPRPNIMRMDSTQGGFARHAQFDAIITDPPYGIRAMSRSMKKKEAIPEIQATLLQEESQQVASKEEVITENETVASIVMEESGKLQQEESRKLQQEESGKLKKSEEEQATDLRKKKQKKEKRKQMKQKKLEEMTEEQKKFKKNVADKLSEDRRKNWQKFQITKVETTARENIFEGLLNLARKHLKIGGRLVFLYPIYEQQTFVGIENLPAHEGFEVLDMSENLLSKGNSRILVTLERRE